MYLSQSLKSRRLFRGPNLYLAQPRSQRQGSEQCETPRSQLHTGREGNRIRESGLSISRTELPGSLRSGKENTYKLCQDFGSKRETEKQLTIFKRIYSQYLQTPTYSEQKD